MCKLSFLNFTELILFICATLVRYKDQSEACNSLQEAYSLVSNPVT